MRCGFVVPFADAREFADIAKLGEDCGWDAVFTWEAPYGVDAWVTLGVAALLTETIRLGTLVTPVSRVRPWDLASRVGTVDRLSAGRVILGAGLGALHEGWTAFEPDEGRPARAAKLDESLAIYAGLLAGQPFSYDGAYYSAKPTEFNLPDPPVQRPHPPVWVVGAYASDRERQPSLDRAARWEGVLPQIVDVHETEDGRPERGSRHVADPDELAHVVAQVRRRRTAVGLAWAGYEVVIEADSSRDFLDLPGTPGDWAAAGATWWIESWWSIPRGADGLAEVRRRVAAGPPAH